MVRLERKLGPKGQVAIPKAILKARGLWPGMTVTVDLDGDKIIVEPKTMSVVNWLEEHAKKHSRKITAEDIHKAYEEEIEERVRRAGIRIPRR